MKNILCEKPTQELHGRTLYCTKFVDDKHIKNKNILDIGCGFGWFELHACANGCKDIVASERTDEDLTTARNNLHDNKVRFQIADATSLPFDGGTFDTVVSWDVIEHIPMGAESNMLGEVFRVLRKGGVLYLSTPHQHIVSILSDPAFWVVGHRHYSEKDLSKHLTDAGFKVQKIALRGRYLDALGSIDLYLSKWVFRSRSIMDRFIGKTRDEGYCSNDGFMTIFVQAIKV